METFDVDYCDRSTLSILPTYLVRAGVSKPEPTATTNIFRVPDRRSVRRDLGGKDEREDLWVIEERPQFSLTAKGTDDSND